MKNSENKAGELLNKLKQINELFAVSIRQINDALAQWDEEFKQGKRMYNKKPVISKELLLIQDSRLN